MKDNIKELIAICKNLLKEEKYSDVIELLRIDEANSEFSLTELLAKAYFLRDGNKDIFAANFFATRAIELGYCKDDIKAIKAITHFKKHEFDLALATFNLYSSNQSSFDTRLLVAISKLNLGLLDEASSELEELKGERDDSKILNKALEFVKLKLSGDEESPHFQLFQTDKQGIFQSDSEIQKSNALSKKEGVSFTKKDKYYIKKSIPCQASCPAHTNVPEYLTAIFEERFDDAYKINLIDNVFPSVLGRVCARPCEADCRHGNDDNGDSVAICHSKRATADHQTADEITILDKLFPETGKSVSIVGAGPAGLALARELALYGHSVTIYEQHSTPGGMMVQGIPEFRLPRRYVTKEIEQIEALGVNIICNTKIGKDISIEKLRSSNDAVVLSAGTLLPNMLDIPGKELGGIVHGLEFLKDFNDDSQSYKDYSNITVIGGGFTAMDCARVAKRIVGNCKNGANDESIDAVELFYRRSKNEMLITPGELEELENESIPMHFLISPVEYIGDENNNIKGVKFIKNSLGEPDSSGRRRPIPIDGSEFVVKTDLILLATGQFPDLSFIDEELSPKLIDRDKLLLNDKFYTNVDKLFACGDFANGASSLIDAIASAKKCAREIDFFLIKSKRVKKATIIENATTTKRIIEMDDVPLTPMPAIPICERGLLNEVELGFDKDLSQQEAQRCYRCHFKYEIDQNKCIYCDWCIKARSKDKCIVAVKNLNYSKDDEIIGYDEANSPEETSQIYIDQSQCIRCNKCLEACPVGAISIQKVSRVTMCQ